MSFRSARHSSSKHDTRFRTYSVLHLGCLHGRIRGGHIGRARLSKASGLGRSPRVRVSCRVCKAPRVRAYKYATQLRRSPQTSPSTARTLLPYCTTPNKPWASPVTKPKCVICRAQFYSTSKQRTKKSKRYSIPKWERYVAKTSIKLNIKLFNRTPSFGSDDNYLSTKYDMSCHFVQPRTEKTT